MQDPDCAELMISMVWILHVQSLQLTLLLMIVIGGMMPGPCEVGLGILEYPYGSCYILCIGVNFPGSWMQC